MTSTRTHQANPYARGRRIKGPTIMRDGFWTIRDWLTITAGIGLVLGCSRLFAPEAQVLIAICWIPAVTVLVGTRSHAAWGVGTVMAIGVLLISVEWLVIVRWPSDDSKLLLQCVMEFAIERATFSVTFETLNTAQAQFMVVLGWCASLGGSLHAIWLGYLELGSCGLAACSAGLLLLVI